MIEDEVFIEEMHRHLKAQNISKKERTHVINCCLIDDIDRDALLDEEQYKACLANKKQVIPTEFKEQCDTVAWFKKTYPGVVIMSIRNGGYRTPKERTDQIREGLHPGAADLFIPEWLCWVEMKRVKGGVQSEEQKAFEDYINKIGQRYFLCLGAEMAKETIQRFIEQGNILNK